MKRSILLCLALFFVHWSCAQDTTSFYGMSQYIFQHVDRSQINTGLMSDYGIEFLELANYDGTILADSNYVGMNEWRLLYASLYSAQINNFASLLPLDSVNQRVLNRIGMDQPISMAVLHYDYQSVRPDAVSTGLLTVSNDQLYDVPGRPASPYQTRQVFAVAPIRQAARLGNNDLIFRSELFFANTGKTVDSIAIALGDTSSYRTVALDTPYTLHFDTAGFVNLTVRVTYTDASVCYGHTKLLVYPMPDDGGDEEELMAKGGASRQPLTYGGWRASTNVPVTATQPYLGEVASGDITIQLAIDNSTGQIRKPLIVVEGIDLDDSYNFESFIASLTITLNQGLDNINEYDLIFLNFADATDYIQRNAYLLQTVIQYVNDNKTTYGGVRQDNVIIGLSMGGLVARYALRHMEQNSLSHETRLFISHDTPHHGANVPVGAQVAAQHLAPFKIITPGGSNPSFPTLGIGWEDMFPEVVEAYNGFNSPAAKQMLIQRYTLTNNNNNYTLVADNSMSQSFYMELNGIGWPQQCKNLTLSNGACNGTKVFADNSRIFEMTGSHSMGYLENIAVSLGMYAGAYLSPFIIYGANVNPSALQRQFSLSLYSTRTSINLDFRINAIPSSGIGEVYRGDMYVKRKILWLFNRTSYIMKTRVNSISGTMPLDNAPGGLYDMKEFGVDPSIIQNGLPSFLSGVDASILQPRFCFVPTVSSLAIPDPWQNLTNDICPEGNCLTSSVIKGAYTPSQNQLHISYTQPSTDWILQWQDASFDCTEFCESNPTISGPSCLPYPSAVYTISGLPTGATVIWSIEGEGAIISSSSGNEATVSQDDDYGYFRVRATITTNCGEKKIQTPNINFGLPYDVYIDEAYCEDGCTAGLPGMLCTGRVYSEYNNIFTYYVGGPSLPFSLTIHYMLVDSGDNIIYSNSTSSLSGPIFIPGLDSLPAGTYTFKAWVTGGNCGLSSDWLEEPIQIVNCP